MVEVPDIIAAKLCFFHHLSERIYILLDEEDRAISISDALHSALATHPTVYKKASHLELLMGMEFKILWAVQRPLL